MITKEQLDAIIKAVNEGGDDDDEIRSEDATVMLAADKISRISSANEGCLCRSIQDATK